MADPNSQAPQAAESPKPDLPQQSPPALDSEPTTEVLKALGSLPDLPAPQQREIIHTLQSLVAYVERSSVGPKIDPETVRIVTASVDKDNENKFKYLTQKQANDAAKQQRDHEFAVVCHTDNVRLFKPVLISTILVFIGCVAAGISFIAIGREAVGSGILSGVFGAGLLAI